MMTIILTFSQLVTWYPTTQLLLRTIYVCNSSTTNLNCYWYRTITGYLWWQPPHYLLKFLFRPPCDTWVHIYYQSKCNNGDVVSKNMYKNTCDVCYCHSKNLHIVRLGFLKRNLRVIIQYIFLPKSLQKSILLEYSLH